MEDNLTRAHRLFNELQEALGKVGDEVLMDEICTIAKAVDAAHHDFTELTLEEIA